MPINIKSYIDSAQRIYDAMYNQGKYRLWRCGTVIYVCNRSTPKPDGVSILFPDNTIEYWKNNKLHRLDGPAIEWKNGYRSFYIKGKLLTEKQFNEKIRRRNFFKKLLS